MVPPVTSGGLRPTTRRRVDSLTSLRAVAAALVFFLHFAQRTRAEPGQILNILAREGQVGVVFFFCLSGFVLTWSHRTGDSAVPFWRRRFARIYPAYLIALIIGLAIDVASHGRTSSISPHYYAEASELPVRIITQALLLQSWIPIQHIYFSLNGVGWSLSCEALFYACFPALIVLLPRLNLARRRALQVTAVASIVVLSVLAQLVPTPVTEWLLLHAPFTTLLQFLLGITVALDVIEGKWSRLRLGPVLLIAALAYLVCTVWFAPLTTVSLPLLPILALLAAAAQPGTRSAPGLLEKAWFVWLGEISYCFYLVHQSVVRAFAVFGQPSTWGAVAIQFCGCLALSVLIAWLLHRLVEKPLELILRGTSRRKAPATLTT